TVTGGNGAPFSIGLNALPTGTDLVQRLQTFTADPSPGSHTITLNPLFHDPSADYYLTAMVDPDDQINESNEFNNTVRFDGGSFILHDPVIGQDVLEVHGTDNADALS